MTTEEVVGPFQNFVSVFENLIETGQLEETRWAEDELKPTLVFGIPKASLEGESSEKDERFNDEENSFPKPLLFDEMPNAEIVGSFNKSTLASKNLPEHEKQEGDNTYFTVEEVEKTDIEERTHPFKEPAATWACEVSCIGFIMEDPELPLALRVSMDVEQARQEEAFKKEDVEMTDNVKVTNGMIVNEFRHELLHIPPDHELDEHHNDLGGCTSEVQILDVGDGTFEVMSNCIDLGGDDFDKRVDDWLTTILSYTQGTLVRQMVLCIYNGKLLTSFDQLHDILSLSREKGVIEEIDISVTNDFVRTTVALHVVFHTLNNEILRPCVRPNNRYFSWSLLKLDRLCSGTDLIMGRSFLSEFQHVHLRNYGCQNGNSQAVILVLVGFRPMSCATKSVTCRDKSEYRRQRDFDQITFTKSHHRFSFEDVLYNR